MVVNRFYIEFIKHQLHKTARISSVCGTCTDKQEYIDMKIGIGSCRVLFAEQGGNQLSGCVFPGWQTFI